MNYSTRIKIAVLLSLLIHAGGLALLQRTHHPTEYIPATAPEPIVLDLQPDRPKETTQPRQLIDVAVPQETPPDPTDHIAESNAEAMDLALREHERPAPALEQDEFDALPRPAALPEPATPAASAPTPQTQQSEDDIEREVKEKRPAKAVEKPVKEPLPEPDAPSPVEEPREAPIRIAQAQPTMPQRPEKGKSRERGGVSKQGQTNFDAIQSEIAPYLKHIRQRVEQQWNQMLYTRYSGTSPVKAVIDCAINAKGELVSVTVVGTDNDKLYSALCRDAVQRAGPFGPFTFEVPDIYKGKNLEIRWTFNFL